MVLICFRCLVTQNCLDSNAPQPTIEIDAPALETHASIAYSAAVWNAIWSQSQGWGHPQMRWMRPSRCITLLAASIASNATSTCDPRTKKRSAEEISNYVMHDGKVWALLHARRKWARCAIGYATADRALARQGHASVGRGECRVQLFDRDIVARAGKHPDRSTGARDGGEWKVRKWNISLRTG